MNHVLPRIDSPRFSCPTCNALASQHWKQLFSPVSGWGSQQSLKRVFDVAPEDEEHIDPMQDPDSAWSASQCAACGNHSLWIGDELVFPSPGFESEGIPAPNADMPTQIKELYLEASAVLPHSRRAAAALCRAALEMLAKELTPDLDKKVQLDGRLVALAKSETTGLDKLLQVIRHVGNKALHGADPEDVSVMTFLQDSGTTEIATLFFTAINDLAYEHLTRPKLQQEAYDSLPQGVRENYEKKTQAAQSTP